MTTLPHVKRRDRLDRSPRPNRHLVLEFVVLLLVLAACAPGSDAFSAADPAGFFTGIWHGWIAPITLIWQIFNSDIRVYEPLNTGLPYDLGFYMAIIAGFGSIRLTRRNAKSGKASKKGDSTIPTE